jgi:hypothetical protein
MIFYHPEYKPFSASYLVNGIALMIISVFLVTLVLHLGSAAFVTYASRFLIVMAMAGFCITQSILDDWNWWSFPTHFIQTQIFDLVFSWALCGMFLAWYFRPQLQNQ